MRPNPVKRKLLAGQPTLGTVLALGSPVAAETLAYAGFDFLVVDNQHGAWDDESSMYGFWSATMGDTAPFVRVRQNDFYAIGRVLDRGALGVIVPMVNTAEEARAAAYAMRYPPRGGRSWAPWLARYHGVDYDTWIDDEVMLAVQIESAQAAECAEEIMSVPGVDACWIGPVDLARSMGVDPSQAGEATCRDAIRRVLDACHKTGKIPGIHLGKLEAARYWLEQGFRFVTVSDDLDIMLEGARAAVAQLGRRGG